MAFRTAVFGALISACLAAPALAEEIRNPLKPGETWPSLKFDVVGDREIRDGSALFTLEAPYRAHDAAIVPVEITQNADSDLTIEKLFIVVDENPVPVVGEFEFGPSMGQLDFETRVRVDLYSNIRAIAEASDGNLYMAGRFVKASGGCSAPALKDMESSIAQAGKMKMRFFGADTVEAVLPGSDARPEAQVMVRHPNFSGMQMNQVTQLFIPAFFVDTMEVKQGDEMLFRMSAGISISEDPVFRFKYTPTDAEGFSVKAVDTDGNVYEKDFAATETAS